MFLGVSIDVSASNPTGFQGVNVSRLPTGGTGNPWEEPPTPRHDFPA